MGFESMTALEERRFLSVSANIRVLGNETTIEAGQSVHVNAMGNSKGGATKFGDGDAITSEIEWNFHDPSGSFNKLPGFNAAHVYDKPGKYKVTLRVTNAKGETDTAAREITVLPSTRRQIYVNPWGSDKNNGKTPDTAVATVGRAMQLAGDNADILFRSGMCWTLTKAIALPFSNVQVGAYGKGATPKLELKTGKKNPYEGIFALSASSHQVTIENLLLEGLNDFTGEAIHTAGSNITIKGIDFENLDSAIMNSAGPQGVLAMNNQAGVLRSYFAYVKGSDQVYLGNIAGDSTAQHNIRIYGTRILAYGNDLTNLPKGTSLATLRVNDGSNIYWSNNILRAGQMYVGPLGPKSDGSTADQAVNNVVIENNRWKEVKGAWSSNVRVQISPGTSNVMVRDNYIDATNVAAINVSTYSQDKFKTGIVDRTVSNLQVLSNTVVNPGTAGAFLSVGGAQTNAITLKDSLYVAPNLAIGEFATAAVRVLSRDDLLNFTSLSSGGGIDGNVWNLPAAATTLGVNYVSSKPAGDGAYRTPAEWDTDFPQQVGNDSFKRIMPAAVNVLSAPVAT